MTQWKTPRLVLKDIEKDFGQVVVDIIDGLTKIEKMAATTVSVQAENFRKNFIVTVNRY